VIGEEGKGEEVLVKLYIILEDFHIKKFENPCYRMVPYREATPRNVLIFKSPCIKNLHTPS
jgi:hypothetical protein